MKNNLLALVLFCIPFFGFSQKTYQFDTLLEYEFNLEKDSTNTVHYIFLTNFSDNSYHLVLREVDSLNYSIYFRDNELFTANSSISKVDFEKADVINNDCQGLLKWDNSKYQKRLSKYTITKSLRTGSTDEYRLSEASKTNADDNIAYNYYVLEEDVTMLPLFNRPLDYEVWNTEKSIPNGTFIEFGTISKKYGFAKYVLKRKSEINKRFQVPENCSAFN
jgi:hypothetical protein